MNKLLVASEYTEPSHFIDRVNKNLEYEGCNNKGKLGLLLITKNIKTSTPIALNAQDLGIPTVTHITITGLGGTKLEPKVPNFKTSLLDLQSFIQVERNLQNIVLRIDPLIPEITDFEVVDQIVKAASHLGITRCRTSVIDYYPFVRKKFHDNNLPIPTYSFQPPPNIKLELLSQLFTICEKHSMTLESCAEHDDIPGLIKIGCANQQEWKELGLNLRKGLPRRKECFCNVTKYDLLAYEPSCPNNCLYCYWGKYR